MQHKKIILLGMLLWLSTLTACGPKVIDESDLVSIDYKYTFSDWTVIEEWSKDITIWNANDWIESTIMWAKLDDEFSWTVNWKDHYKWEYNPNKIQSFANIILTEVMWISDPEIWTEVEVNSIWKWIITKIEKDSDGYDSYIVEFNEPKTYSDLSYYIKITNIEKL